MSARAIVVVVAVASFILAAFGIAKYNTNRGHYTLTTATIISAQITQCYGRDAYCHIICAEYQHANATAVHCYDKVCGVFLQQCEKKYPSQKIMFYVSSAGTVSLDKPTPIPYLVLGVASSMVFVVTFVYILIHLS